MIKKELIIVAGANGSGKTTLSKQVMQVREYDFLNADEIAKEIDVNWIQEFNYRQGECFLQH